MNIQGRLRAPMAVGLMLAMCAAWLTAEGRSTSAAQRAQAKRELAALSPAEDAPAEDAPAAEGIPPGRPAKSPRLMGVASCAAYSCHGYDRDRTTIPPHPALDIRGDEYTLWLERDPHARAYQVLYGERSRRMAQALGIAQPQRDQRCLSCHSTRQSSAARATLDEQFPFASQGVSCEACHGAASQWLVPHTASSWSSPSEQSEQLGFRNTADLVVRAETCAGCHVGGGDDDGDSMPDRDMNHDMIAAGHPRLAFDFATYLENYPPHWLVAKDRASHEGFHAKAWAVGQAVSLRAALELLAARAEAAADDRRDAVWPELSEYSCYACHHDLASPSWRQETAARRDNAPRLGAPTWASFYTPLLPIAAAGDARMTALVGQVGESMAKPIPDAAGVADIARQAAIAAARLARALNAKPWSAAEVKKTLTQVIDLPLAGQTTESARLDDWDTAASRYLATLAMCEALLESEQIADQAALTAALERAHAAIAFPTRDEKLWDSPKAYGPQAAGGAASFDAHLQEILRLIAH